MAILLASKMYRPSSSDPQPLTEQDSSKSLVALDRDVPHPTSLFKYQDRFISSLDVYSSDETQWLPTVCSVSKSQVEGLLGRWSRLRHFEESLRENERKAQAQKRESQQPYVESDSEDDISSLPIVVGGDARMSIPTPHHPGNIQTRYPTTVTLPIPVKNSHGATPPLSPASSYGTSTGSMGKNLPIPVISAAPVTPHGSLATLPVEAAAAVEAKDMDDDIDLEIPWTLCTRRHYWKYIDGKIRSANTEVKHHNFEHDCEENI